MGGGTPLILGLLLLLLPESASFMAVRRWPVEKVRAALLRLFHADAGARSRIENASGFYLEEPAPRGTDSALSVLLAPELRFSTLTLWTAYFMGLLLYYLLTSWMPTLVRESGHTISDAATVTALFPLGGGIGALICGWLMDRVNATRVVCAAYALTALLLAVLSRSTGAIGPLMAVTFLAGIAMNGAQTSMPVLAAETYPTVGRASGVSWMLGVGRLGGILGALGGGGSLAGRVRDVGDHSGPGGGGAACGWRAPGEGEVCAAGSGSARLNGTVGRATFSPAGPECLSFGCPPREGIRWSCRSSTRDVGALHSPSTRSLLLCCAVLREDHFCFENLLPRRWPPRFQNHASALR